MLKLKILNERDQTDLPIFIVLFRASLYEWDRFFSHDFKVNIKDRVLRHDVYHLNMYNCVEQFFLNAC